MSQEVSKLPGPATVDDKIKAPGQNGHEPGETFEDVGNKRAQLLQNVRVGDRSIGAYASIVGQEKIDQLWSLADKLKGARVLHLNSTAYGGGVAEILRTHISLLRSLGIDADWMVIHGEEPFFNVTKAFHNALQGGDYSLDSSAKETYLTTNSRNAKLLDSSYDFVVVHDPQPAAIRQMHGAHNAQWVWRCHIDTSCPNPEVWEFLKPYVEEYDALVYTMQEYVSPGIPQEKVSIIAPAIDPLSPKNTYLNKAMCEKIISWVGIDPEKPLITQVSRFDPWKDPLGVLEVYHQLKKEVPDLQLALLGHLAADDPQGWLMYDQVVAAAGSDPDIHMFTNFTAASSLEVNAFQRRSDVVIQKSIREGFGLVVAEALWKGTPVVAGRAGGIPLQLQDGKSGYLIDSTDECANKVYKLLQNPKQARKMGLNGKRHIRSHFLSPRLLDDELTLLSSLGSRSAVHS